MIDAVVGSDAALILGVFVGLVGTSVAIARDTVDRVRSERPALATEPATPPVVLCRAA